VQVWRKGFKHAHNFKQPGHGCARFTFTRAPLANGVHGYTEVSGGLEFIEAQSVNGLPYPLGNSAGGWGFGLF
jgi:hypothetical protein